MFPLKNTLNKTPITDKQNNSPLWIAKELTKNQVHNKLFYQWIWKIDFNYWDKIEKKRLDLKENKLNY